MINRRNNQRYSTRRRVSKRSIIKLLLLTIVVSATAVFAVNADKLTHIQLDKTIWRIDSAYPININHQLQQLIADELNKNYFAIDLRAVKNKLLTHPWVANVNIKRLLLNDIIINVTAHRISLRFNQNSYISDNGVLFKPNTTLAIDKPLAIGDENTAEEIYHNYQHYQTILRQTGLDINVIEYKKVTELTLNNNLLLKLGYQQQQKRLERFVKLYPKLKTLGLNFHTIDLRYRSGFSLSKYTTD